MINRTRYKTVRVHLEYVDAENRDEAISSQILLDMTVESESLLPDPRLPNFGVYGSPIGDECYPFVLRNDGKMDFGSNAETQDRFHHLNITKRRIEVGQMVTYTDDEGEFTYRVKDVN